MHMESTSPSMSSPLSSSEQSPQLSDREDVDDNEESSRQRCGWLNCGNEFDILDDLIVHVRDVHIGSGKVRTEIPKKLTTRIPTKTQHCPFFSQCTAVNGKVVLETKSLLQSVTRCIITYGLIQESDLTSAL